MTPEKKHAIEESFARQTLMDTLGARLVSIEDGQVVIEAALQGSTKQQHGFAHAGLTFAIGDSAAGYSAMSLLPEGSDVLTAEIKINLLAPAKGPILRATGHVIKAGRRLVVVSSVVQNIADDGTVTDVAVLQGTMVPA
ncbi:PaaI family thioesterase [Primorskyibacter sp. S187A]|uniref:PaaI family thioesterase n=1 Tax=Primorskyibacter sp. S187A TaxID=3415130 RepID=UPI003C7E1C7C